MEIKLNTRVAIAIALIVGIVFSNERAGMILLELASSLF
jgi:hypothetical protein